MVVTVCGVNVEDGTRPTLVAARVMVDVSHTCGTHSEPVTTSTEVGFCTAATVGGGFLTFHCMFMPVVRWTSSPARMLVFVKSAHMTPPTIHIAR